MIKAFTFVQLFSFVSVSYSTTAKLTKRENYYINKVLKQEGLSRKDVAINASSNIIFLGLANPSPRYHHQKARVMSSRDMLHYFEKIFQQYKTWTSYDPNQRWAKQRYGGQVERLIVGAVLSQRGGVFIGGDQSRPARIRLGKSKSTFALLSLAGHEIAHYFLHGREQEKFINEGMCNFFQYFMNRRHLYDDKERARKQYEVLTNPIWSRYSGYQRDLYRTYLNGKSYSVSDFADMFIKKQLWQKAAVPLWAFKKDMLTEVEKYGLRRQFLLSPIVLAKFKKFKVNTGLVRKAGYDANALLSGIRKARSTHEKKRYFQRATKILDNVLITNILTKGRPLLDAMKPGYEKHLMTYFAIVLDDQTILNTESKNYWKDQIAAAKRFDKNFSRYYSYSKKLP